MSTPLEVVKKGTPPLKERGLPPVGHIAVGGGGRVHSGSCCTDCPHSSSRKVGKLDGILSLQVPGAASPPEICGTCDGSFLSNHNFRWTEEAAPDPQHTNTPNRKCMCSVPHCSAQRLECRFVMEIARHIFMGGGVPE